MAFRRKWPQLAALKPDIGHPVFVLIKLTWS